jgi:hypothetical protein
MNSVFLSPNFPPNFANFAVQLKQAGACVLGLGDDHYDDLSGDVRRSLTDYYRVDSMHDYDELVRAMGYFTHRYGKMDHLDSHNEYWLETEARLRTDFNIEGIDVHQIGKIKRKSEMKEVFLKAGLKPARGRVCHTREELLAFIAEVGYPVVAKPNIGVGAAKTFKICSECEIDNYFAEKLPEDYIVEEYCEGQIVTYDGLVDGDGNVVFSSSLRYSRGVMDVVNEDSDIYYHTVREIEPELEAAGIATLKAFDMRKRFFHLEFFMNEGVITPLEVNIRPPGGLTLNMMNYTFDADCYHTWANLIVNGIAEPMGERSHLVFYVGRKDRIPYQITHQQVLEKCSSVMMHHERLNDVFSGALGNYGYLLRHEEMEPLMEATELIQRRG